tara:strand:+ start:324 stop:551 length:228 start_codon:yes stop_codon:yes gene_type:complete
MTLQGFNDFLHSALHSASLRRKLIKCQNNQDIINLARSYRFIIDHDDFEAEGNSTKIEKWFKESQIYPIKTIENE